MYLLIQAQTLTAFEVMTSMSNHILQFYLDVRTYQCNIPSAGLSAKLGCSLFANSKYFI